MGTDGKWKLAPAFDVIWAYNTRSPWTGKHQLSVNGKRDGIVRDDLMVVAKQFGIRKATDMIERVISVVKRCPDYAEEAGVSEDRLKYIASTHLTSI